MRVVLDQPKGSAKGTEEGKGTGKGRLEGEGRGRGKGKKKTPKQVLNLISSSRTLPDESKSKILRMRELAANKDNTPTRTTRHDNH